MFTFEFKDEGLVQRLRAISEDRPPSLLPEMRDIANRMWKSVDTNFQVGGRPRWTPTKSGGLPLTGITGRLRHGVHISEITETSARVSAGEGLPYPLIHQFGGTIQHPGSNKLQVFQVDGETVFTHHTRPHRIGIPERRYMMFQQSDINYIRDKLTKAAFGEKK